MNSAQFNIWPELAIDLNRSVMFNSLAEARDMLEIYTYYYRQQSSELQAQNTQTVELNPNHPVGSVVTIVSPDAVALRDTALSLLACWSTSLDNFLSNHGDSLSERERRGAAILQLRKIDCFVALDVLPPAGVIEADDNVQWDKYCPLFEQMVALGETIIALSSSSSISPSTYSLSSKTFSLDLGIIAAMFNVAARCRDPYIRRRAVRVLRSSTVQEGVWNSVVVATIAEKWIEIEEEGLGVVASCADIPAVARLTNILPVFDVDQPSALVYFSHSSIIDPGMARREILKW